MDTSELMGDWLNVNTTKAGDVVTIIGQGYMQLGKFGKSLVLPIELNGRKLQWSANRESLKNFQAKWGFESDAWKDKKFQITFGEWQGKKTIIAVPI